MIETSSSDEMCNDARLRRLMRVGNGLRSMVQWAESMKEAAARKQKLHPTDFACIGYLLRQEEAVNPKQIIGHLGLSSGSGTALLDRLEKSGFVRRMPNPHDRRGVLIELDRDAADGPIQQFMEVERRYREVTDKLTDRDLDTIAEFLEGISKLANEDKGGD